MAASFEAWRPEGEAEGEGSREFSSVDFVLPSPMDEIEQMVVEDSLRSSLDDISHFPRRFTLFSCFQRILTRPRLLSYLCVNHPQGTPALYRLDRSFESLHRLPRHPPSTLEQFKSTLIIALQRQDRGDDNFYHLRLIPASDAHRSRAELFLHKRVKSLVFECAKLEFTGLPLSIKSSDDSQCQSKIIYEFLQCVQQAIKQHVQVHTSVQKELAALDQQLQFSKLLGADDKRRPEQCRQNRIHAWASELNQWKTELRQVTSDIEQVTTKINHLLNISNNPAQDELGIEDGNEVDGAEKPTTDHKSSAGTMQAEQPFPFSQLNTDMDKNLDPTLPSLQLGRKTSSQTHVYMTKNTASISVSNTSTYPRVETLAGTYPLYSAPKRIKKQREVLLKRHIMSSTINSSYVASQAALHNTSFSIPASMAKSTSSITNQSNQPCVSLQHEPLKVAHDRISGEHMLEDMR